MSEPKKVSELTEQWNDDGASRGPAYIELRDLARQLELALSASQAREAALREKLEAAELLNSLQAQSITVLSKELEAAEEELRKLLESKVPEDGAIISNELARFLNGSDCIDGVWFGEEHPRYRGRFWWRKLLPTQPKERPSTETDLDEAQRRR